jgi:hypothetical protein
MSDEPELQESETTPIEAEEPPQAAPLADLDDDEPGLPDDGEGETVGEDELEAEGKEGD